MLHERSSDHLWLRTRIRLLCIGLFAVSLFLPPYVPETFVTPPPDYELDARQFLMSEEGFLMKTSSLTEQGNRSAFSQGILHTVEAGESIASIARQSFLKPETIRWANGLKDNEQVRPGQTLLILPVDGIVHTVKRGQNLKTIATLYGVDLNVISRQNKIRAGYLVTGQELIVPGGRPIVAQVPPKPTGKPIVAAPPTPPAKLPPELTNASIQPSYGILQMPCDCFYTQYFGPSHFGVDLQHRGGSPIFAAEAGVVIRADYGWDGGYGNVIEIDHGNGLVTLYGHNKVLYVKKGDRVARGQAISFMGNTGRVHGPTGIHLHFEVHTNGTKRNPLIYLQ